MTQDQREQVKAMLLDIIENMERPKDFQGSTMDFRRDWLFVVADEAVNLAKERFS